MNPLRAALPAMDAQKPRASSEAVKHGMRSAGSPLAPSTRAKMEAEFGHDFGSVRVFADAAASESAEALEAEAYTLGNDIVFGQDAYSPDSLDGRELLAHELTHVVQQGGQGGGGIARSEIEVSNPNDPAEQEADEVARSVMAGEGADVATEVEESGSDEIHRWPWDDDEASAAPPSGGGGSGGGAEEGGILSSIGSLATGAYNGYQASTDFKPAASGEGSKIDWDAQFTPGATKPPGSTDPNDKRPPAVTLPMLLGAGVDSMEENTKKGNEQLVKDAEGIPVLSQLAQASAFMSNTSASITGGIVRGVGDIGFGMANAFFHPIDAAMGIEGILEHNTTVPFLGSTLKAVHGLYDVATDNEKGEYGNTLGSVANHVFNPLQQQEDDAKFNSNLARGIVAPGTKDWDEAGQKLSDNPLDFLSRAGTNILPIALGVGEAAAGEGAGEVSNAAPKGPVGVEPAPPTLRTPFAPDGVPVPKPFEPNIPVLEPGELPSTPVEVPSSAPPSAPGPITKPSPGALPAPVELPPFSEVPGLPPPDSFPGFGEVEPTSSGPIGDSPAIIDPPPSSVEPPPRSLLDPTAPPLSDGQFGPFDDPLPSTKPNGAVDIPPDAVPSDGPRSPITQLEGPGVPDSPQPISQLDPALAAVEDPPGSAPQPISELDPALNVPPEEFPQTQRSPVLPEFENPQQPAPAPVDSPPAPGADPGGNGPGTQRSPQLPNGVPEPQPFNPEIPGPTSDGPFPNDNGFFNDPETPRPGSGNSGNPGLDRGDPFEPPPGFEDAEFPLPGADRPSPLTPPLEIAPTERAPVLETPGSAPSSGPGSSVDFPEVPSFPGPEVPNAPEVINPGGGDVLINPNGPTFVNEGAPTVRAPEPILQSEAPPSSRGPNSSVDFPEVPSFPDEPVPSTQKLVNPGGGDVQINPNGPTFVNEGAPTERVPGSSLPPDTLPPGSAPETVPHRPEFPRPPGEPVLPEEPPKLPGGPKEGPPIPREEPVSGTSDTVRQPIDIPGVEGVEPLPPTQDAPPAIPDGPVTQDAPPSNGSAVPTERGLGGVPAIPRGMDPGIFIDLIMDSPGGKSVVELMQELGFPVERR